VIVVDASIALSWYLEDEASAITDVALRQMSGEGGIAPSFWPMEIANAFQMAVRSQKISRLYRDEALNDLLSLGIEIAADTLSRLGPILRLSDRYTLTAYDSAYVELAQRRRAQLATVDKAMAAAARAEGLTVLP
jgi:predicted nucleic acid-binding protein